MAVYAGPEIVTNGLVLALDAGNTQSYPGSGTVWRDLSQGLSLNSYGTTTPWSSVSRGFFSFNNSGYWQMDTGSSNVPLGGDCTIIMWLYYAGHSLRRTILEKAGTIYQSYEQELAMTWEVDGTISYYSRYSTQYDFGAFVACDLNRWTMMAIKLSTGLSSTARTGFYSKNGAPWVANYTSRSNTALTLSGVLRIGTGYSSTVQSGSIASVSCYNRMLSDAEVAQNFNATRGRFGI